MCGAGNSAGVLPRARLRSQRWWRRSHPEPYPMKESIAFSFGDLLKANPCPCGYYGDMKRECRCSPRQIESYRQRISGPLLDRIDLHIEVPLVNFRELSSNTPSGERSETIRERVVAARNIQLGRFKKTSVTTNAAMTSRLVRQHCQLDSESTGYLEHAMEEMNFSARAHDRILKVARTLADLGGSPDIRSQDILEAIQYRSLDRKLFA